MVENLTDVAGSVRVVREGKTERDLSNPSQKICVFTRVRGTGAESGSGDPRECRPGGGWVTGEFTREVLEGGRERDGPGSFGVWTTTGL